MNKPIMKQFISELIEKTKKQYCSDYSYMLRDFNQETETTKGYNGRQLLELLQNCDDEGSKEVLIELDQANKTIAVHNNGTPFSKKGYRSLFISNLSSKTSQKKYIGNKGLGFRSVINWSNSIEIQSNNLSLLYSENTRKQNFNKLFSKEKQDFIRDEENISNKIFPMPFLTLPSINQIEQNGFITKIIIQYKEQFIDDILRQIEAITPETVLFLKHIGKIEFSGIEGKEAIECSKKAINKGNKKLCPRTQIDFKDSSWRIFEKEEALPPEYSDTSKKEEEVYQIKIAIEKDFKKTSPYLYSFFPTRIRLEQPYILHATFNLDATRNQINDSGKNRFILQRIVEFTIDVAKYYTKRKVSYRPLEILNHNHNADTLHALGYYNLIEEAIENEALFPCIDNTYKTKAQSIYVGDSFAETLLGVKGEEFLTIHLIPSGSYSEDFINSFNVDEDLSLVDDFIGILNKIFKQKLEPTKRAKLIYEMTKFAAFLKDDFTNKLSIFTNDKGRIIAGSEYIYTPITKGKKLKTPSYAHIQFVNQELFDQLVKTFNFESDDSSDRGRFIAEMLNGYCNIHSYEPATLARKIVSAATHAIERDTGNKKAIIQEMNRCLYHNFQLIDSSTKLPPKINVPTITASGKIDSAANLVLSKHYPIGQKTHLIFQNIYTKKDFVGSPEKLGLDGVGDAPNNFEQYLIWLGVNKYAKYIEHKDVKSGITDYVGSVLNPNGFTYTHYSIDYLGIVGFEEILEQISIEKLILWIYLDGTFRLSLDNSENTDDFRYFYRTNQRIYSKPSYLKFVLQNKYEFDFSKYLIDDNYSWVNEKPINYNHDLFQEFEISKTEINEILIKLGAIDDFLKLSVERVAEILNLLTEKYPNGNKSQTVYKKALNHYSVHEKEIDDSVQLFANDGNGLKLYPQGEVYFSDKVKLPRRLHQDFPIFNFPSRAGGSEAIKFFGINDLRDVEIEIESYKLTDSLSDEFKRYFNELKPFILAQRLNEIDDAKQQKYNASICNQLSILLCTELNFSVSGQPYVLSDYEYIHQQNQTYIVKVQSFDSIQSLTRNIHFAESFADVISMSFDIFGYRNEFKYMLRSNLDDVKLSVINDFGKDILNEARSLLGLSDHKQAFWEAVFVSKGIPYGEHLDDFSLEEKIRNHLHIELDISSLDYENLIRQDELIKIEEIFNQIHLGLDEFNENYVDEISLSAIHYNEIKNAILDRKLDVKVALWHALKNASIEEQQRYLDLIDKVERFHDFASSKASEFKFKFEIDTPSIAIEFIENTFGPITLDQKADLIPILKENSKGFTVAEMEVINQDTSLKSLLYFDTSTTYLKEIVCQQIIETTEVVEDSEVDADLVFVGEKNLVPNQGKTKKKRSSRGVYFPKSDDGKKKKKKGDSLEELVFNYMMENEYKNVDWVSRDNEGLHCDIRYTNKDGRVKYVEVKAFDNNSFYLSREEYLFGKNEADHYEIWLVKNYEEVITIKDFFTNSKYTESIIANEYKINLKED